MLARTSPSGAVRLFPTCMNLTLKTKAALVTTLLVLGAVSLAGGWLYRQQAHDHVSLLRSQQDALATAMAADVDYKLAANMAVLTRASRRVDAALLADPVATARFFQLSGLRPPFDGVALVAADGVVIVNDPPNTAPVSIADRDYFRRAELSGQPTISPPLAARTTHRPAVLMTVPLFDAQRHFIGALAGGLSLLSDSALGELSRRRVGTTGYLEIVTRDAVPLTVVHPDSARLMQPAREWGAIDDADTEADFVTRRSLRSAPWELRIVIPAREAHGELWRARRDLLASLLLLGLGTALLVSAGMGWLMRPLENLWQSMRRQRRSPEEAVPIDTSANDERGLLAREFAALMGDLRAQRAELAAVSDASPLGLFRSGLDGRLVYVNEAYLRIHGLARDEAAEGWLAMVPGKEREAVRRAWQRIVKRPKGLEVTRKLVRKDGREIMLKLRSAPVIVGGVVQGHVGTVADVTQRIEGERAMRTLNAIFDASPDFVLQSDPNGRLLYMNAAARRAQGLSPDAPIGHLNALAFNPPETVARHAVEIVPTAIEKGMWLGESLQWNAHREPMQVSHLLIAHKDARGQVEYFSAVLRDITSQKTAEHDLHRSEAVLRSVADLVPMAIAVVDKNLRDQFVNQGFEAWSGRQRDEVVGRTVEEVLGAEEWTARRPWIERAVGGERVRFERSFPERAHHQHLQIEYIPLFAGDGEVEGFVAVTADLSSRRAEERRLRNLADTDALTQLLNRAGFERALDERAALAAKGGEGGLVAVLYIDLDQFKPINDQYGHAVGDQLLSQFAERLRGVVRPSDTIARVGGDEFVIVLDGLHEEANAMRVAEQVVAVAESSFELPDLPPLRIGASVGVAFWRPGQAGWAEALDRADAMLYRAKAQGRGRAVTH